MCLKILVLTIVTVSASKTKDSIREQYFGPPKTDFGSDGLKALKPRDNFGSNADRQFGESEFEEKYKLSVPSFDNHRSFNEEFNHRQFLKHHNDHGFENFERDFGSQSNLASGSTERNYKIAIETGFRRNTHKILPLVLGNLDHSVGFESSDKEVRVRDRSIESHKRHSSSNNFNHDNSFQGSSQTFYNSGSDSFHTESLGNIGDNQRNSNSRFHQGGHRNHFKSHDFENSNIRSESSYGDIRGSDQRESGSKNERQVDTNRKTETVGEKSDFDQNKSLKKNIIVTTTETATFNRNRKKSNDNSYQENTNANNYNDNLHTNERDSEDIYASSHRTDSRNSEEENNSRAPDRNTRLPEDNNRNRNNADTTQNKNEHANGPSGVGRRINHDNTNQRVDKPNETDGGDEWTWGEEEEKRTTTTKLPDIGDRAAFTGDKCPTGKVKIGNTCVTPD